MTEPASGLASLAAKLAPSAVGAVIALRFNTRDISAPARAFAVVCSLAIGHYVGGGVVDYLALLLGRPPPEMMANCAHMGAAVFGLSLIASVTAEIPKAIAALRRKFLGDSQ